MKHFITFLLALAVLGQLALAPAATRAQSGPDAPVTTTAATTTFAPVRVPVSADELAAARWPLARDPHLFETTLPGVFAVGDVRAGNVKRVASAVGEGSIAVSYGQADGIPVPVPIRMAERYVTRSGAIVSGEATYDNFRLFETSARIVR